MSSNYSKNSRPFIASDATSNVDHLNQQYSEQCYFNQLNSCRDKAKIPDNCRKGLSARQKSRFESYQKEPKIIKQYAMRNIPDDKPTQQKQQEPNFKINNFSNCIKQQFQHDQKKTFTTLKSSKGHQESSLHQGNISRQCPQKKQVFFPSVSSPFIDQQQFCQLINDSQKSFSWPSIELQTFDMWPDGYMHCLYSGEDVNARTHQSGWAMRNTNNHDSHRLKKSCLGVMLCSQNCQNLIEEGSRDKDARQYPRVYLRPFICDKARNKQKGSHQTDTGSKCPTKGCPGVLIQQKCTGHAGKPVTHVWRSDRGLVFFQAKGLHDHSKPNPKPSGCGKRRLKDVSVGEIEMKSKKIKNTTSKIETQQRMNGEAVEVSSTTTESAGKRVEKKEDFNKILAPSLQSQSHNELLSCEPFAPAFVPYEQSIQLPHYTSLNHLPLPQYTTSHTFVNDPTLAFAPTYENPDSNLYNQSTFGYRDRNVYSQPSFNNYFCNRYDDTRLYKNHHLSSSQNFNYSQQDNYPTHFQNFLSLDRPSKPFNDYNVPSSQLCIPSNQANKPSSFFHSTTFPSSLYLPQNIGDNSSPQYSLGPKMHLHSNGGSI